VKKIILTGLILLISGFAQATDFTLNLGISHSLQSGRFFDPFSVYSQAAEGDLNRDYQNRTGVGLDLSLQVSITPRLSLVPGIGIVFGHQEVIETVNGAEDGGESETRNEFFRIVSASLDAAYRLFALENRWNIDLLAGMGRSRIHQENMLFNITADAGSFWHLRLGIAAAFRELRHWGARFQVMSHLPLNRDYPRYLSLQGGVLYRF